MVLRVSLWAAVMVVVSSQSCTEADNEEFCSRSSCEETGGRCTWASGECGCNACSEFDGAKSVCMAVTCGQSGRMCMYNDINEACDCPPASCEEVSSEDTCNVTPCPGGGNGTYCEWTGSSCGCPITSCSSVKEAEQCAITPCPDDTTRNCSWSAENTTDSCSCPDHETEVPTTAPDTQAPAEFCSDISNAALCMESACPEDDAQNCTWVQETLDGSARCECVYDTDAPETHAPATRTPDTAAPATAAPVEFCSDITNSEVCMESACPEDPQYNCTWVTETLDGTNRCECIYESDAPETLAPETEAPETPAPETSAPATQSPPATMCADIKSEEECMRSSCPEDMAHNCSWSMGVNGTGSCECVFITDAPSTGVPATDAPDTAMPTTSAPETEAPAEFCSDIAVKEECMKSACPDDAAHNCSWVSGVNNTASCECIFVTDAPFGAPEATPMEESCAQATNQETCERSNCKTGGRCTWASGECGCNACSEFDGAKSVCMAVTCGQSGRMCMYNDINEACDCPPASCEEVSSEDTCNVTPCPGGGNGTYCEWTGSSCGCPITSCSSVKEAEQCAITPCPDDTTRNCSWNESAGCECNEANNPPTAAPRTMAPPMSCIEIMDEDECKSSPCPSDVARHCRWVDSTRNGSHCECAPRVTPVPVSTPQPPPAACNELMSETECMLFDCPEDSTRKCAWNHTSATCGYKEHMLCKEHTSENTCESNACQHDGAMNCVWSPIIGECSCPQPESCAAIGEELCQYFACPENPELRCEWSDASATCGCTLPTPAPTEVKYCSDITTADRCAGSCPENHIGWCQWSNTTGCGCRDGGLGSCGDITFEELCRGTCPEDPSNDCVWSYERVHHNHHHHGHELQGKCECMQKPTAAPTPVPTEKIKHCSDIANAEQCRGVCPDNLGSFCVWQHGHCGCFDNGLDSCQDITEPQLCGGVCPEDDLSTCEWDGSSATCRCAPVAHKCSEHATPGECHGVCPENPDSLCHWDRARNMCGCFRRALRTCRGLAKQSCLGACPENPSAQCEWDEEEGGCACGKQGCSDYGDPSSCVGMCPEDPNSQCVWSPHMATCGCAKKRPQSCAAITYKGLCNGVCPEDVNSECVWAEGSCGCKRPASCSSFVSQGSCYGQECPENRYMTCHWDAAQSSCSCRPPARKCSDYSKDTCGNACPENPSHKCAWNPLVGACECAGH
eukprot:TRINITY_DN3401_c3_g1_i3.p1 TRINITY_DN3401_c3_g1~~TRINITY_DN3401_c3_g1_i3.p1  ORF type:complete len:1198 (+),score=249.91 TRINITY_DN3401_c3_g1_i3:1-3594(+)